MTRRTELTRDAKIALGTVLEKENRSDEDRRLITRKLVTIWKRWNEKTQQIEFNHIEDGHVEGTIPLGTKEQNVAWKNGKWHKSFGELREGTLYET